MQLNRKLRAITLTALLVSTSAISGCWGGATATPTRRFLEQLDNNAIAAREAQIALKQMLDLKLIGSSTALNAGSKVEAFRAANRHLIDFADQPGFKTIGPNGEVVLTFTIAGKQTAEALAAALSSAANGILADKDLFKGISDQTRATLSGLISAATSTAQSILTLVRTLKTAPGAVTIRIPADSWKLLEHAKGVEYGF